MNLLPKGMAVLHSRGLSTFRFPDARCSRGDFVKVLGRHKDHAIRICNHYVLRGYRPRSNASRLRRNQLAAHRHAAVRLVEPQG